jgi:hypothetical protein
MYFPVSVRIDHAQHRPTLRVSSKTSEPQASSYHPVLELEEQKMMTRKKKASFKQTEDKI